MTRGTLASDFTSKRDIAIALYAAGALVAATGLTLRFTVFASPAPGGAMVGVAWR